MKLYQIVDGKLVLISSDPRPRKARSAEPVPSYRVHRENLTTDVTERLKYLRAAADGYIHTEQWARTVPDAIRYWEGRLAELAE